MQQPRYPLERIVSAALVAVELQGEYISNQLASETIQISTSETIREILSRDGEQADRSTSDLIQAKLLDANNVISWVREMDYVPVGIDINYWTNLQFEFKSEESDKVGLVGSALKFYNQKLSNEAYRDLIRKSKYIGILSNREKFFAKLMLKLHKNDDERSGYFLYKAITREGNLITFFNEEDFPVVVGDCFLFEGLITDHNICPYDKVPNTKLSRIKYLENYGRPREHNGADPV